jgi:hypothetical protein
MTPVNAAIGSGEPKASPSALRSRLRVDRADQASTMTLSSPQTWIGPRSERKTPPGSGIPSDRGGQCGWWQATRSGVENDTAGCDREISCSSNPGRNMGFQIYGYCPMRLLETQISLPDRPKARRPRGWRHVSTPVPSTKGAAPSPDRAGNCPVSATTEDAIGILKLGDLARGTLVPEDH